MKLTSPAFQDGGLIPIKYTCDGENINPELVISGVPKDTKTLALIMHDPDAPNPAAPRPEGFTHWVIWNMDPGTNSVAENSVPDGSAIEGFTSLNRPGYVGPCPHKGEHHYQFNIYALDAKLNLTLSSKKTDLEKAMEGHILDKAVLVGIFRRGE